MAKKKKLIKGFYNWTFFAIVVVGIVLVNIISSLVYERFDMTADKRYSLADGTVEFLEKSDDFKTRVNIKIYLEGNLPAELMLFRNAVEDKLNEFKEYAGKKIEFQFIDPHEGTEQEQQELFQIIFAKGQGILPMDLVYNKDGSQSQMLLWPGAIIEYGGSTVQSVQLLPGTKSGRPFQLNQMSQSIQNSINNLEYILVSALRRATQEKRPRIAFLHGHGELSAPQTYRARSLLQPYFSIADITLNDSIEALSNLDGLIIAQPKSGFSDKDLFLIDQFVMKGGRLMCFLDMLKLNEDTLRATGKSHTERIKNFKLDNMLFDYGIKLNSNYMMDARCAPIQLPYAKKSLLPWFYHVLATPTNHPISRNVEPISLKYVSEIQFVETVPTVALTPILTTSPNSAPTGLAPLVSFNTPMNYLDPNDPSKLPELVPNPKNENNKRCIAAMAEGHFKSHFASRIADAYATNPNVTILDSSEVEGKVMVIGNGSWISNTYDSLLNSITGQYQYRPTQLNELQQSQELINMQVPHFFGNQEFLQNLTDYMMGDNSVLDIRSRQIDINQIDNDKVKNGASMYKVLNITLPIISIIFLGILFYYIRKKKYTTL